MGQVLGFSRCKEYGSVSSTPDSTSPCTEGGNEESELYDLQTAREWSDEEDGGPEDDDGGASSPSIWGTPRQNSFEPTFSYIAIAEAEAGGSSRHHRDSSSGSRRRSGARGGRTSLSRTDTVEMLLPLDSPDVEWDPHAFLAREEEEEREQEEREREVHRQTETVHASLLDTEIEPQERDTETQRGETEPLEPRHYSPSESPQAASPPPEPESLVTMETTVTTLTAARPRGGLTDDVPSASSTSIGRNTQEELVSEQWFSAFSLSGPALCIHVAVMDLIYWKDTERTGMVFTGLVVGLLSLFQLSIITVISTISLGALCFTVSVSLYYKILQVLNMGDGVHPFKAYLDLDISFSGELADQYTQKTIVTVVSAANSLKNLFLVGNLFDSLKLLALMYLVTFLGVLCNGLTVLIIAVITLFSLPLFYRQHQAKVDGFFAGIQAKIDNVKDILHRIAQGGGPTPDPTPGGAKPKTQ
ncbi:reticulon-3-like isoform X1 [Oncorhynchus kisutch]|uniref:Reticulon n=1 Tax=Oncorhynchus kisutch TaxID=8019 RepID=A0A8C7KXC3_ONCKI|nr:reticulon-3-like isoform X1 [Oncorhynchus kisutch]